MFKKMKNMEPFLLWWLICSVVCFIGVVFFTLGGFEKVYQVDFTRISFLIFSIFSYYTVRTGMFTYTACKRPELKDQISEKSSVAWFFANKLTGLGMIGTVFGFIKMLSSDLSVAPGAVNTVMTTMLGGAGAALYTTAAGLICGLLLQLQLLNLERHLNNGSVRDIDNEEI
jgi:hypothetical protein